MGDQQIVMSALRVEGGIQFVIALEDSAVIESQP